MFPKWSAVLTAKRGFSTLHGGCTGMYQGVKLLLTLAALAAALAADLAPTSHKLSW